MFFIIFLIFLIPKLVIVSGVLAFFKSFAVTLLTPLSVDCADKTTAIKSVKTSS